LTRHINTFFRFSLVTYIVSRFNLYVFYYLTKEKSAYRVKHSTHTKNYTTSKNCKDLVFNVYEVDDITKYQVYKPDLSEVPDIAITEELWILTPVKLKFVGKIKCTNSIENDGHIFKYGDNIAKLYDWEYEMI